MTGAFAFRRRFVAESLIEFVLVLCSSVSIVTTLGIIGVLFFESSTFFAQVSLSQFLLDTKWTPLFVDKHFGIWPLVAGTFLTSFIALLFALPVGVLIAIYLSEYANGRTRTILKPLLEILAGIPTIVYGYFALLVVTPALQTIFPEMGTFNALSPGLVLGIMILPMVASLSEDAIYAVPTNLRDGAYALGASRLQTIFGTVVPAAAGGISAAFILSASRAIGETMIVAIAAGQQPELHLNPLQPVQTMTTYIVQISLGDTPHGTLEYQTLFAVAIVLFMMTMALNYISLKIRNRYKKSMR